MVVATTGRRSGPTQGMVIGIDAADIGIHTRDLLPRRIGAIAIPAARSTLPTVKPVFIYKMQSMTNGAPQTQRIVKAQKDTPQGRREWNVLIGSTLS